MRDHRATGSQFSYTSFTPDGTQIAWQESDGIHVGDVGALSNCASITDHLVIPGGTQPFFGAANVNLANAPSAPTPSSTLNPGGSGGNGQPTGGGTGQPGGTGGNADGRGTPPRRHHRHRHQHHPRPPRRAGLTHRARPAAMAIRPTS